MKNLGKKLKMWMLGVDDSSNYDDYEENYDYDEREDYGDPVNTLERNEKNDRYGRFVDIPRDRLSSANYLKRSSSLSNVIEFNSQQPVASPRITFVSPQNLEEARIVADYVKGNIACVVILEKIDSGVAQRIADFIAGGSHTLGGKIELINNRIFMVVPASFNFTPDIKEELESVGLGFFKVSNFL